MKLNNITHLEDFEMDMEETVVLSMQEMDKDSLITHFVYLTPEQVAEIVKIDKEARQTMAASEVPGQGKAGLQGQGSHLVEPFEGQVAN